MWRRFSWSADSNNTKPQVSQTVKDTAPEIGSASGIAATATAVKSATPLNTPPTAGDQKSMGTSTATTTAAVKEHELSNQRPMGWGQRRRSSIMERLARESTKEGLSLDGRED